MSRPPPSKPDATAAAEAVEPDEASEENQADTPVPESRERKVGEAGSEDKAGASAAQPAPDGDAEDAAEGGSEDDAAQPVPEGDAKDDAEDAEPASPPIGPEEEEKEPVDPVELHRRLSDPGLRKELVDYLQRKFRIDESDADALAHDAAVAALVAKHWQSDPQRFRNWMKRLARNAFVNDKRKNASRAKYEVPSDKVDRAVERPPVSDMAEAVQAGAEGIAAKSEQDARALRMLRARADGEKVADIAVVHKITEEAVYKSTNRLALKVRKWWAEAAIAAVAGFIVFCLLTRIIDTSDLAGAPPGHHHGPTPTLPEPLSPPEIRAKALKACSAAEYEECLDLLNRAQGLDAEGEKDPKVVEARRKAESAVKGSRH